MGRSGEIRVLPHRKVPAAAAVAVLQLVPVGEEHRVRLLARLFTAGGVKRRRSHGGARLLARLEPHAAERGHHVWPVVVVGDAAEAFRLRGPEGTREDPR